MFENMQVMHIDGLKFAHFVSEKFGHRYDSEVGTGLTDSWSLVTVDGDLPDGYSAEDVAEVMDTWLDGAWDDDQNSPAVEVILYVMHLNGWIDAGTYLIGMGL